MLDRILAFFPFGKPINPINYLAEIAMSQRSSALRVSDGGARRCGTQLNRRGELQAKWTRCLGSSENSFMGSGSFERMSGDGVDNVL